MIQRRLHLGVELRVKVRGDNGGEVEEKNRLGTRESESERREERVKR